MNFEELGLAIDLSEVAPYFMVKFPNGFADEYIVHQDVDLTVPKLADGSAGSQMGEL